MIRAVLVTVAAIAATVAVTSAAAQSGAPVRKLSAAPAGQWAVLAVGSERISHCVMGVRSDAPAPQPGKPQFMISADDQFAILRVRAAEWTFSGARDIAVTLATDDGAESAPAASVRGADLIDIAFGPAPEQMAKLAASSHLEIRSEGTFVRLPLAGLADVLSAYRDCLSAIGQPAEPRIHAALHAKAGP